jgi:di/tricarboxylate transporter
VLEGASEIPRTALASAALLIVGSVVTLMALKIVPVAIAALGGVIAMIVTRVIPFERLGRALNAEVIVLVASSIALGRCLTETGAADWLGALLSQGLAPLPPAFAVAGVMAFCALITNFSSNAAAASVTTPIAVAVAQQLGIDPIAMVMAVIFGCNLGFATPVAYQTNILIMAAAGYRFGDFMRAGGPLVILMVVVCSTLLAWKFGL